jgi:hypothetical protein
VRSRDYRSRLAKIDKAGIEKVAIRSALTCKAGRGVCVKCYGRDLARGATASMVRGCWNYRCPIYR